ncbi:MAG: putative Ig domain-containing protein, partial [Actinobacteria bacterium]|nr:putative Ig domain-containing protein [Actinomycetota bacterium]
MKPTGAGFPVPHRDRLRAGHHARVRRGRLLAVAVASSALAVGLGLPALFPGASAGPPWNAWAAADTGGGNGGDDVITLLDLPNPDAATNEALLGTGTGTTGIRGLAVQPSTGVLFGATTDRLGVVSPITGEFTAVGSGFGSGTGSMGAVGFDNVQGIAFDDSGRLFAVHEKSGDDPLFEVDPVSGTRVAGAFGADDYLTLESSATTYSWMQDLAIDPISGGAFVIVWDGSAHYKLATADLVTGSLAMPDATLDAAEPHGLSFDTAGQAWAIGSPGAGGVVAPVDKAAGTLGALIAIDDAGSYQALAFIPPNSAPAFDQDLGDRTDAEGGAVSLASPATDPEGDTLIWSATGLPGGLSVDPSTGQISGTIDFTAAAASPYSIEIRVEDPSGGFDLDTFTWTVTDAPAPRPPVFDQDLGDRSDIEGAAVSASAHATDPDGDPLTYSATGLPPGLSIDAGTGIISGTVGIGAAAGSPYSAEVTATDPGGLFAADTFTWSVTDGSIVFQQGAAGYSGFQDTGLWQHAPGTARGNETYLTIDQLESGASSETQGLIQFLDIVGTGPGHIPPGSTVVSASLQVYVIDPSPGSISFHPMISAWDESATWNGLGNGIQPDGVEAGVTPEVVFGATGTTGQRTIAGFENSVQAWVDGTSPNRGWALFNDSEDGWDFDSSEYGEEARRPRLLVDFTPNAGPVFALNLGDRADAEGAVISLSSAATDPEGHGITYSATGLPPGLGIDTGSGLISGTIALTAAPGSPYAVQVTATDDYGVASGDTFTWTITDTNEAPSVVNPGNRSNNENQIVTFVVAGSDPDGDSLTWSATGLPDGLTIDPASGVISGTLSYVSAGVHAVTVRATDPGLLFDEAGFTWTVADVNQGPQVVHPGSQTVAEGDAVSMVMTAIDPDGDGFTWSATGLPAGLSIDPVSGLLSGTVDWGAASGSPYNSTITATDDGTPPASGAALVDWTVSDTNRAPAVTNPGNQTSAEGDPVSLPIVGNDPDGDTLTWSATGLPPGLSIDTGSGTVSGIVDFSAAAGSPHAVVVTATDNGIPVQAAQAAFTWAVTDVNRNPVVTDPGDQTDAEGDAVLVTVTGLDPDGDTLTWSAAGLPPGLSIDPATGEIFGTLTFASSGTHPVAVRATDDGAGSLFDEVAFTWSVASTNRQPVVTDPGAQADAEGDVISLPMAAADPDGDDLTWSASGLPDGLSIGPATGVIGGAIGYAAAAGSPFTVTVRVTDDGVPAAFDEVVFEWSVADVNRAPTVASPGDQAGAEGEVVNVPVAGADPDGDPVWWSAAGLPQGLGIDTETGELVGSIAYSAAEDSPFLVTVRMTDQGGLFGEASFAWSVSNTPTVIDIAKASDVVGRAQPGDTVVYRVVVTNPESTPATGVMVSDPVPAGTDYVPGSGSYSMVDAARDSFESGGYQGDDGTIPWSGPWVELDGRFPDTNYDGIDTGAACSGGSCLMVGANLANSGVERSVDLAGAPAATLTYEVAREAGGGQVAVRVRGNGLPWTTLATYTLTVNDLTPLTASFDISAFAAADTTIRVVAAANGSGHLHIDDVAVITGVLTAAAGPPPGMVSGLTLAPGESVTVLFSVVVNDPPPGSGTIANTATVVTAEEPGGVSDAVSDPVNRYPVFLQDLGDRTDAEGTVVSLPASATDPDGDTRTWSATGLPAGLSIDSATGLISGTIGFDAAAGSP